MLRRTATNTHGMILAGAGGTAAGNTSLGTITLPAGGPWQLFGAFGQAVRATATAAEMCGGTLIITSPSGDVVPNPAPLEIPIPLIGSFLGALESVSASPLALFPLDLVAAGKATLEFTYDQPVANTAAPQVVAGVLFGSEIKEIMPPYWYDSLEGSITAAASTALGTITISESATEIVGICANIAQNGVITAGEELTGFISIQSDDIKLTPLQLPFSQVFGAGLGATINNTVPLQPVLIPTSIPVVGGARLDVNVDLNTAVTNAARVQVYIAYR